VSSMVSDHILPITQSKLSLPASYKTGAQSLVFFLSQSARLNHSFPLRCTAPHNDLDGGVGGPRSHVHTSTLLSSGTITLQELWDDYGIVGDLLVRDIISRCLHRL